MAVQLQLISEQTDSQREPNRTPSSKIHHRLNGSSEMWQCGSHFRRSHHHYPRRCPSGIATAGMGDSCNTLPRLEAHRFVWDTEFSKELLRFCLKIHKALNRLKRFLGLRIRKRFSFLKSEKKERHHKQN